MLNHNFLIDYIIDTNKKDLKKGGIMKHLICWKLPLLNFSLQYISLDYDDYYYLINEFCGGGDVAGINDKYGIFPEFFLKYTMYQVFLAINCLHMKKVVHGDIKRENIAFVYEGKIKEKEEYDELFNKIFIL